MKPIRSTKAYLAAADALLANLEALDPCEVTSVVGSLRKTSELLQAHRPSSGFKLDGVAFRKGIVLRNAATKLIAGAREAGVAVPGDVRLIIQQFPDVISSSGSRSAKAAVIGAYQPSPGLLESLRDEREIARFEKHQTACLRAFQPFTLEHFREFVDHDVYRWSDWSSELATRFARGIPLDFLNDELLSFVMVYRGRPVEFLRELLHLESRHSSKTLARVLREHYVGLPEIVSPEYLTSHNTQVQFYHLDRFAQATATDLRSLDLVVEWGGGYGAMARILKKIQPGMTYVIIDLPPVCGLQAAYLTSIFGAELVRPVVSKSSKIQRGKINIVPVHLSGEVLKDARPDLFISITALTESSPFSQAFVSKADFFRARRVLVVFDGKPHKQQELLPAIAAMRHERINLTPNAHHYYALR